MMKTSNASLSFSPKSETTKSFAPGGWMSTMNRATARSGDGAPEDARDQLARAERGTDRDGAREREPPSETACRIHWIRHRTREPTSGRMTGR